MGDITELMRQIWADGPSAAPTQPPKSRIRNELGPLIEATIAAIAALAGAGLQWKMPVALATTGPITLSGEKMIDGTMTATSWVLVKDQASPAQNGIYVTGSGNWARRTDADTAAEIKGMAVYVRGGAANRGKQFVCTASTVTVDTTPLPFVEISDQTAINAALTDLQTFVDALVLAGKNVENISIPSDDWDYAVTGYSSRPIFGIFDDDLIVGFAGASADLAALSLEAKNLGYSAGMEIPSNARFARPFWDVNLVIGYGQSLSSAQEAWANWVATATPARSDTFMIGNAVQPQSDQNPAFVPYGSTALVALKPTVSDGAGHIYTPSEVAALPAGNEARGYASLVGAVNYAARAFEDDRLASRKWVAMEAGSSGKTIEDLSPGASPLLYNRFTQALSAFVAAVPGPQTKGVAAILWKQGEWNYDAAPGDRTKDGYKAKLKALKDAMNASVASATGQSRVPVMLTYQTGGAYVMDDTPTPVSIGMAQWEASREREDIIMVGPVYQVPDKGGHLTADGSAWFGQYEGKVLHRVVTRGERWEPLSPLWTKIFDRTVYIGFHVPEPPLAFDLPYVVATATDYRDKGFRVRDGGGFIPIDRVRLVGATIVAIDLARSPYDASEVTYGSAAFNGGGCLRDSDPTIADAVYQASDIPALTGKPYPLQNWAIAFAVPVNWSRI